MIGILCGLIFPIHCNFLFGLKPLKSSSNFLSALHLDESIVNIRASFFIPFDSGSLTFYY